MELFNNDQYVLSAYAHTTNEFGDAGNTAILRLMQNDHVTIKARPGRDVELFGSHNQVYATFSGALLSPSIPGEEKPSEGKCYVQFRRTRRRCVMYLRHTAKYLKS